jgi:hypothetical protein
MVTIMLTWYSEIEPLLTRTCCSFTHALLTLRNVLLALASPCYSASSKLFVEVAVISETLATEIESSLSGEPSTLGRSRLSETYPEPRGRSVQVRSRWGPLIESAHRQTPSPRGAGA